MEGITRRQFAAVLGGAAAWPLVVEAQQSRPVKRIAILMDGSEANGRAGLAAFRAQLDRSGWFEGQNLQSTVRFGDGQADRIRALSAELVELNADLIIPAGSTGLSALLSPDFGQFPSCSYRSPIRLLAGIVASLAHPGGNATGFMAFEGSLGTKWLQLLKEIAPAARGGGGGGGGGGSIGQEVAERGRPLVSMRPFGRPLSADSNLC